MNKPFKTPNELNAEIAAYRSEIDEIIAACEIAERDLTESETSRVKQLCDEIIPAAQAKLKVSASLERERQQRAVGRFNSEMALPTSTPSLAMRDSTGRPVFCLGKQESVASTLGAKAVENGMGQLIQAAVTGRTGSWTPPAVLNSLSTNVNTGGGFLVPDELAATVIDKARATSVLMNAGCSTIPMSTGSLSIARIMSDPTIEVKAENAAFSEASITFGKVIFDAQTIGCLITSSRELAEDAPNFPALIEGVISRALATKLDWYGIQGTGSAEPLGLCSMPDIDETGSVGGLTWEDLAAASSEVRQNNHMPRSIVLGVEPHEDLMVAVGGDGSTSTKTWLLAPPALDGQNMFPTNNCPLAKAVCGDFSFAAWGIRTAARIEISTEANEAFERHQLKLKIVFRGDFGVTDPSAFHRLAGITS